MCFINREQGAWYPPLETAQLGAEESLPERGDLQRLGMGMKTHLWVPPLCPSPVPGVSH